MIDKITRRPKRIINHVYHRRGRYGAVAGFATASYLSYKMDRAGEFTAFLESKGIDPTEFYLPEM